MARSARNKLLLPDIIRYGSDLARGVLELHLHGSLALNLKPCNFLLDDQDRAVVGEFGLPLLFLGTPAASSGHLIWLGTPNYMAPEQWDAHVRGPIHFETDAWGFACSIIEMIGGFKPWDGMSAEEIFSRVVVRGQSPSIPAGLPVAIFKIMKGCFEYDYRKRPNFEEILAAFTSPNVLFKEGDWVVDNLWGHSTRIGIVKKVLGPEAVLLQYCDKLGETVVCNGASKLNLWKNPIHVGDMVRVKPTIAIPRFSWHQNLQGIEGAVAEIDKQNSIFSVKFSGSKEVWQADPVEIELICSGIVAGDWVLRKESGSTSLAQRTPSSVGIVHHVQQDANVKVAFLGRETLWTGSPAGLSKLSPFCVGQFVKLKNEVSNPRFDWPLKKNTFWETGKVSGILPNGCLIVDFPGRLFNSKGWFADPQEVEAVTLSTCHGLIEKYEHLEAMHWSIRPILCLLGFLAAARVGTVVSKQILQPVAKKKKSTAKEVSLTKQVELQTPTNHEPVADGKQTGGQTWLLPAVANVLFKEGGNNSS
ncbi:hypothetical protein O6H91_10G065300 [Diphasiastrum complanatum]|nr:hypothetical protein O6H91_10G065300 [Diphasiastrum complanatum]